VLPTHVVSSMRASLFEGTNQRTEEALVHRKAKLSIEGRKLLVDRVRNQLGNGARAPGQDPSGYQGQDG
jgi:hypothetical protein